MLRLESMTEKMRLYGYELPNAQNLKIKPKTSGAGPANAGFGAARNPPVGGNSARNSNNNIEGPKPNRLPPASAASAANRRPGPGGRVAG